MSLFEGTLRLIESFFYALDLNRSWALSRGSSRYRCWLVRRFQNRISTYSINILLGDNRISILFIELFILYFIYPCWISRGKIVCRKGWKRMKKKIRSNETIRVWVPGWNTIFRLKKSTLSNLHFRWPLAWKHALHYSDPALRVIPGTLDWTGYFASAFY